MNYYDIEQAWWAWGRENYPGKSKSDRVRVKWMYENMDKFVFDGETWTRTASSTSSNSGKTAYWTITYKSASGRQFSGGTGEGRPVNRRNDPERNWGLPE